MPIKMHDIEQLVHLNISSTATVRISNEIMLNLCIAQAAFCGGDSCKETYQGYAGMCLMLHYQLYHIYHAGRK